MMKFASLSLAVLVLVVSPAARQPANAEAMEKFGQWTVMPLSQSCYAFNRPAVAMNATPWNSLAFHASKNSGVTMQVHYWPGYIESVNGKKLQVTGPLHSAFETALEVKPAHSSSVMTVAPLPAAVVEELRRAKAIEVGFGPEWLTFDLEGLAEALSGLESCQSKLQ
jgi:hypothetical protein